MQNRNTRQSTTSLPSDVIKLSDADIKSIVRDYSKVGSLAQVFGYKQEPNILRVYRLDDTTKEKELIHETTNTITVYYRAILLANALFGTVIGKDNTAATYLTRDDLLTISNTVNTGSVYELALSEQRRITVDYRNTYAFRYVAIGCGGIDSVQGSLLTTKGPAMFNSSSNPIADAHLYVPLHFGQRDENSPDIYKRYITDVNQQTQEQYLLIDRIEPIVETNVPIPLALKITFTIPNYLANYEQQDWNRPDLAPYQNDKGIVFINEFGFYFTTVNLDFSKPENTFMFSHVVTDISFPKTKDVAYVFEYTVYF